MKLQILSDTHALPYEIDKNADLIVHLGDFGNGISHVLKFVNTCKDLNKDYVLVLGNHDFYGSSILNTYQTLDGLGINYLKDGKEFVKDGITFVGGTLFTNFRMNKDEAWIVDQHKENAKQFCYDFHAIVSKMKMENGVIVPEYITPEEYITLFYNQYNWINKYRGKENVVVLTHFPMTLACLDPYWSTHPTAHVLNPYFINDLDLEGFKLVLSGHTHTAVDRVVNDCRVIVNASGYPAEQYKNGFKNKMIIEV